MSDLSEVSILLLWVFSVAMVMSVCLLEGEDVTSCAAGVTGLVLFRYFLHGVCREGSRCLFSHDPANSKPSTICKFYQRGVCAYGERCR